MKQNERDVEGFDSQHYDRKQQRKNRRQKNRRQDGGKRMHQVGGKDRWHWDGRVADDE